MIKIEMNDFKTAMVPVYYRNNRRCVLDKTKDILRVLTPEEEVRQCVVQMLRDNMQIPLSMIETEIPLSYFANDARGRMDIVVFGMDDKNCKIPLMVVECKAPEIPITDEVYQQADSYAEIVDIPFVMVTNGVTADISYWNKQKQCYEQIHEYPSYKDLCHPVNITKYDIPEYSYHRYNYRELYLPDNIEKEYGAEFIGDNCKKNMVPIYVNLAECFLDNTEEIKDVQIGKGKFIADGGVRYTSFGNASGGAYPGLYRYIIIEDIEGNNQIISFTVMSCANGRTLLIVAIDDFDTHHNSLQLSLEHFSYLDHDYLTIYHDGTLTVGNKGKAKRETVLQYIKEHSDLQIEKDKILLGRIDCSKLMKASDSDINILISHLTEYAMVRDEFRKQDKCKLK